MITVYKNPH